MREIHLRVDPGASEDLRIDITAGEGTGEDPPAYNISFETEWSHKLPFPDACFFRFLHRNIVKTAKQLEDLRLAARTSAPD